MKTRAIFRSALLFGLLAVVMGLGYQWWWTKDETAPKYARATIRSMCM